MLTDMLLVFFTAVASGAFALRFIAGNVAGLIGVGGGSVKVMW